MVFLHPEIHIFLKTKLHIFSRQFFPQHNVARTYFLRPR